MSTNLFFNNFKNSQEQTLIEDLIVESIKIYGMDLIYVPRTLQAYDAVYGEDPIPLYESPYEIEMYIKNVEGFEGEGDFLSKFNLQIRDQITFTVARRSFEIAITDNNNEVTRPREGDLIYFPLNGKVFEIKFVEHEAIFYQLGSLQTYDIQCELLEYSNQILNTGIADIDNIERNFSLSMNNYALITEDLYLLVDEDGYTITQEAYSTETAAGDDFSDNEEIQTESDEFVDFTELDPFSEGRY
jgi:hypothetical protein